MNTQNCPKCGGTMRMQGEMMKCEKCGYTMPVPKESGNKGESEDKG